MKSLADLDTPSFKYPLVLVPDSYKQRSHIKKGKVYPPPCYVSSESFQILGLGLQYLAVPANFDFTEQPAYQIFNSSFFKNLRFIFWKPILKRGHPIYIVSPLFGLLWPGDKAGTYNIDMEEVYITWKNEGLCKVVEEIFYTNQCDGVLSYLPTLYDNVVRVYDIPWERRDTEQFKHDVKYLKNCRPGHKI